MYPPCEYCGHEVRPEQDCTTVRDPHWLMRHWHGGCWPLWEQARQMRHQRAVG